MALFLRKILGSIREINYKGTLWATTNNHLLIKKKKLGSDFRRSDTFLLSLIRFKKAINK